MKKPWDRVEDIAALAKRLDNNNLCFDLLKILKTVSATDPNLKIWTFLKNLSRLRHGWQRMLLFSILRLIPKPCALDLEEIGRFVSKFKNPDEGITHDGIYEVDHILLMLKLVAPQDRMALIEKTGDLKDQEKWCELNIMADFFDNHPEIHKRAEKYLHEHLDNLSDRENAYKLANEIKDIYADLYMPEHSLAQKAEVVAILAMPGESGKTNPYILHQRLKNKQSLIALASPVVTKFKGMDYTLNLEGFRKQAVQKGFTFGDLSQGVGLDSFNKLFESLDKRLKLLSPERRSKVEEEIEMITSLKRVANKNLLAELKSKILSEDKEVYRLLTATGAKDAPIKNSAFYLYAILQALQAESDQVAAGAMLSDRESKLMQFASMIFECNSGQRDGIAIFYNSIPAKFRRGVNLEAATGPVEKVEGYISIAMQDLLNTVLADFKLIEKVAGKGSSQQAHQTLYLKNLLHKELGLFHELTFDLNSQELTKQIIDADPQEILATVLSFLSLPKMIDCVKKAIQEAMETHRMPYGVLNQYFEDKAPLVPIKDFFICDKDYNPLGITDAAALVMLTSMGYVV